MLVESVTGVCSGVVVAASVLCAVCGRLGSCVRLSVVLNIRLDVLLDISLARDISFATDGEAVP